MEAIGRHPRRNAIITDEAILAQQQAIAAAARLQRLPRVGVHAVEEFGGIRPGNLDLAQRRGIEDAHAITDSKAFAGDGGVHVLAGLGEVARAAPLCDRLVNRTLRLGPTIDRRLAGGLEQRPLRMAGQRPEGLRGVGRAESGEADLGHRLVHCRRSQLQGIEIAGLALISRHPVGGVALDMLDRLHALAHRQRNVLGGDVVLEVDEGLDRGRVVRGGQVADIGPATEAPLAGAGPDAADLFVGLVRQIGAPVIRPGKAAERMRPQMHRGRPAPGHQHGITGQLAAAGAVVCGQFDAADRMTARHADYAAAQMAGNAELFGLGEQAGIDCLAHIDDRSDAHSGARHGAGVLPAAVVRGHHRHLAAHGNAVAEQEGAGGAGQHHAGHVVASENQRTFDCPGRQHDFAGADPPQLFARAMSGLSQMVRKPFDSADEVVVVIAKGRGALQQGNIGGLGQRLDAAGQPRRQRRVSQRAAAQIVVFVEQDHPAAVACGLQCGVNTRGAGTHDQQFAMRVGRGVVVRVGHGRRIAQPGHLADRRLVKLFPEAARPHEGLVVEARREEPAQPVVDRAEVVLQRRPAVLAARNQPLINRHGRGAQVGGEDPGRALHRHQRVRLLRPGTKDAARAVVFEAAAEQRLAAGQQRGGQAFARQPTVGLAVEGETDAAADVGPAQPCDAMAAHFRGSPAL